MTDSSNIENSNPQEGKNGFWKSLKNFLKIFGMGSKGETSLRESLEEVIEEHEDDESDEVWSEDERSMLINVLNYGDLKIDDIMVPRVDIIAISDEVDFPNLVKVFSDASHSRLPVYKNSLDAISGMIHVKDLVKFFQSEEKLKNWDIGALTRPVLFVAPSMKPMDLLEKMRAGRTHMAIVVDEYGGTDGLITIEDLVEQIVGDIEDEHDDEELLKLKKIEENIFEASARLEVEDLEEAFGVDFLDDKTDEDVETLGGLVISIEGRVPQIGEVINHHFGFAFEILDADPRKIKKVRIHKPKNNNESNLDGS